ncbi:MAG: hypothetical protein ACREOS_05870, partial [Candidatus Dormibacteraceae bacterium]
IVGVSSRRNRWPQMQTMSGTLYVPSLSLEMNVLEQLTRRVTAIGDTNRGRSARTGPSVVVSRSPAQSLPVPCAAIDYIFTDPPFGSNIFYADCSLLWEAWLGYFTDERYEAVWNKSKKPAEGGKSLDDYERLMTDAFREMYRVLKPGRWASVVFHNSDDRVWQAIQRGAVGAGFEVVSAQSFDKVQLSFKGLKGQKGEENVTNKDVVLNLQKPLGPTRNGVTLAPDVEAIVAEAIVEHLRASPEPDERGLQTLQGLAIRALVNRGHQVEVSWRSVTATLRHLSCKQVDGRWYLPGEEVPGLTFDVRDEASAIGWLRGIIVSEGPRTRGELTPRFQQASLGVPLRKSIAELLAENFILEERANLWRLPTAEERARLNDASRLGQRREINRLLEGHPSRSYSDAELAALASAAYEMGMYAAVLRIAPLALGDGLPPERRALLEQLQSLAALKLESDQESEAAQGRLW